jgi:hypothetical protein
LSQKIYKTDQVMADRMPRVSLAMPVYNGERFISEAIESILSQTFSDFELIITDNCSSDSTDTIVKEFAARDPRVFYHRNQRNIGAANNYNLGFKLARGQYLKWCACDDLIDPGHLTALVAALESDATLGLAYGQTICIQADGRTIPMVGEEMPEITETDPAERFGKAVMSFGTCFQIFGLFRMDLLRRTTLHRPYYSSDEALLAEAALLSPFKRVPEAIFYNREHDHRSIHIDSKLARSSWQNGEASRKAASEHLNLLLHLYEIAGRHPEVIPPYRARLQLVRFAKRPEQLSRYALEILSFLSPTIAQQAKSAIKLRGSLKTG